MLAEIDEKDESMEMLRDLHLSSQDNGEDDAADPDEDLIDDDNDYEDEEQEPVTLGFVQKPKNKWSLLRQLFPSKAGGVPAWLDPNNLPTGKARQCDICGEPLQFLLQVYAPTTNRDSTFHRTLYLFMCPSMSCLLRDQHEQWKRHVAEAFRSVKVFRCQLPRYNAFYSGEPPQHDGSDKPLADGAPLCNWCGTWKGDKLCGGCRRARYCSEKHQVLHWRSGHKVACQRMCISSESAESSCGDGGNSSVELDKAASRTLWPEYEIINEDESTCEVKRPSDKGNTDAVILRNQMDESMSSLLDSFEGDSDKRCWTSFQECITREPDQILRYCRSNCSRPLWPMSSGQPSKADIPNCSSCGGPRCFEFQNDADSLDWDTIAVYSCEASCDGSLGYKEEFAWVQMSAPSHIVP